MHNIHFRDAAIRLYNKFKNMSVVAQLLNIGIASISRWLKNLTPKKRDCKPRKVSSDIKDFIYEQFKTNPLNSCEEIVEQVQIKFKVYLSKETIRLVSKRLGFTYKVIRLRISKPSDEKVQTFKREFQKAINSEFPVVSIDESGFDQRLRSRRGFCPKGREATCVFAPKCIKHVRYNLLLGISNEGVKYEQITNCTCNKNIFADFILRLPFVSGSTLLLDNVSFHKTQVVKNAASKKGYKLLFIPPYSPEYNPIELAFGMLKNVFYKSRFKPNFKHSMEEIRNLLESLKSANIMNFFMHVYKLL